MRWAENGKSKKRGEKAKKVDGLSDDESVK